MLTVSSSYFFYSRVHVYLPNFIFLCRNLTKLLGFERNSLANLTRSEILAVMTTSVRVGDEMQTLREYGFETRWRILAHSVKKWALRFFAVKL